MSNQTYSIRDSSSIEVLKCDLSNSANFLLASPVAFHVERDQVKQRLSDMRKRTKALLARHDWQRFFATEDEQLEHNSMMTFDEDEYELSTNYTTANNNSVSPHNSLIFEQQATRPTEPNNSKLNLFSLNSVSTIPLLDYDSILFEDNNYINKLVAAAAAAKNASKNAASHSLASISKGMFRHTPKIKSSFFGCNQ
jgi:hypothetical protein